MLVFFLLMLDLSTKLSHLRVSPRRDYTLMALEPKVSSLPSFFSAFTQLTQSLAYEQL